jgi:hypothetical protein
MFFGKLQQRLLVQSTFALTLLLCSTSVQAGWVPISEIVVSDTPISQRETSDNGASAHDFTYSIVQGSANSGEPFDFFSGQSSTATRRTEIKQRWQWSGSSSPTAISTPLSYAWYGTATLRTYTGGTAGAESNISVEGTYFSGSSLVYSFTSGDTTGSYGTNDYLTSANYSIPYTTSNGVTIASKKYARYYKSYIGLGFGINAEAFAFSHASFVNP